MVTIEQLESSITDEREAIEMYTKIAHSEPSAVISKVFHDIAVDEMNHLQVLEELLESAKKGTCAVDKST